MNINNKFNIGDEVYTVYRDIKYKWKKGMEINNGYIELEQSKTDRCNDFI